MPSYHLSNAAADDLAGIAAFTIERFGTEQARRYRDQFETCFQTLAENPKLGRDAEEVSEGLRRFEHQSHVIFYQPGDAGILIVRILHQSMDVPRHF